MIANARHLDFLANQKILVQAMAVVLMACLTWLCAKVAIPLPFSPVPVTLQSYAVVLSGILLGSKRGALSQITYLTMGLCGLPVFASPLPGTAVLIGPTAGYLIGFIPAAFAAGLIVEKIRLRSFVVRAGLLFAASLLIFIPGVLWLKIMTSMSFVAAITTGFMPFMIGDLIKTVLAALSANLIDRDSRGGPSL